MNKMTKSEFLERIFTLYQNDFTEQNKNAWNESYKIVLGNPNIDFNKLFETVLREWKYKSAPSTSWLYDKIQICKLPEPKTKITKDWRDKYTITKWSKDSICIKFVGKNSPNGEYVCGKQGNFAKTCAECLNFNLPTQECDGCCHECRRFNSECARANLV